VRTVRRPGSGRATGDELLPTAAGADALVGIVEQVSALRRKGERRPVAGRLLLWAGRRTPRPSWCRCWITGRRWRRHPWTEPLHGFGSLAHW